MDGLESFKDIDLDNLQDLIKEETPEAKEDIPEVKEDIPDVKEETPEEVVEVKEDLPEVKEDIPETTEEDPEELLKKILFENNNNIEEAKKQATEEGNPELVKQLTDLQTALEEERNTRQRIEQANKIKDEEMGKLADKNTLLETENLQKKRIYGAMEEDADLQAAVVYGIQAKNKPEEYKPKFIESLKTLLRREGIDLDVLQQKAVVNEKEAITEGGQDIPVGGSGPKKPSGSVMDMFESMDG